MSCRQVTASPQNRNQLVQGRILVMNMILQTANRVQIHVPNLILLVPIITRVPVRGVLLLRVFDCCALLTRGITFDP